MKNRDHKLLLAETVIPELALAGKEDFYQVLHRCRTGFVTV